MRTPCRAQGFTVLEVLVVIAIIMFLLGMTVSIARSVREQARIHATRALMQQISMALEQYEAEFKTLPPDTGYGLPRNGGNAGVTYDPGSLWRYLSRQVTDTATGKCGQIILTLSAEQVIQYTDPVRGPSYYVVDAWGKPIGFTAERRRVCFNFGGYDLFSTGPDGKTAIDDGIDNGKFFGVSNTAYDGAGADDAYELGEAALNGTLADDLNNWSSRN